MRREGKGRGGPRREGKGRGGDEESGKGGWIYRIDGDRGREKREQRRGGGMR